MGTTPTGRTELQVTIDGDEISGLLRASIATTNTFSADTYSLTFAIGSGDLPGIEFWSSVASAEMSIAAVVSSPFGPTYQELITGMIDTIHVNPVQGIVGVEGRDLSASMIDAYHQQDFVNQTASDIVSTLARYHDLQPVVTSTIGNIGRFYIDGYTKLSLGQFSRLQSDWDLVVQLARQNDFDVFVQGRALYFQPSSQSSSALIPIGLRDVQAMRIEKNLRIAETANAAVQSWNSQDMQAFRSNDPAEGNLAQDTNLPFLFSGSNYSAQQVNDLAGRYTAELGRLATVLDLHMPWDLSLSPRTKILLQDTNSAFDTTYLIDSIERHYSSTLGCTQNIRAAQIGAAY